MHSVPGSEVDVRVRSRCEGDRMVLTPVVVRVTKVDPKGRSLREGDGGPVLERMPRAAGVLPCLRASGIDRPATRVLGVGDGTSSCKQRA